MSTINHRHNGGNNAFHNFADDYSHIRDPNLRRRLALRDIDRVPFGLYHVRAVVVAGVGFFLDSYDIFSINFLMIYLGVVFWHGEPESAANGFGGNHGQLPSAVNQSLKAATSAGIVIGQVLFGWLADVYGRRRMYGIELGIILLATLNCALANPSQSITSTGILVFWRVVMGVGIGGDYPLSSVITSEFAPTRWRGAMVAAVFSMQGIGQLTAAIVALIVVVAFKGSFVNVTDLARCGADCQIAADRSWRLIVGVGAVPACFALYYRITIPETPRYTFDVAQDIEKADADIKAYMASKSNGDVDSVEQARAKQLMAPSFAIPSASWPDVWSYFSQWKNAKVLIGTTMSWFFLDLAFYGLGLNNSIVLHSIGYSRGPTLYDMLYNNAVGLIILACAGSLPGYWTSVLTIDTLGRKPIQIMGFVVLTILFCVLGFSHKNLNEASTLGLYVVAQFFFNFGPNTTTFIVPGECFPTRYRSTGHGVSAAMGKIGAILAQVISIPLLERDRPETCAGNDCSPFLDRLMQIFALFMLLGTLTSLLIPETKGSTLEELAGEDDGHGSGSGGGREGGGRPGGAKQWWKNPLASGQPAGFFLAHQRALARAEPRVGIMTSPELAAQQQHRSNSATTTTTRRGQYGSGGIGSGSPPLSATNLSLGSPALGAHDAREPTGDREAADAGRRQRWGWGRRSRRRHSTSSNDFDLGAPGMANDQLPSPAILPGWGAGWGRMDRGGQPASAENMRLRDVGSLLK
ncbi:hypothetical protein MAPG_11979 [Magnaporthiopsis poae ATCC 64411]|uniref:Major facilitator superfamily (MFS) profile domain-containing protein n=1 Tax=Magnaporthiopsis poae (strain ATCC 64411 / 73-15) TaxID=644358 RepID=A0A0C4EGL5_MAGP6|nr:hypothetical protein MAPG_11979 [Magnaporthiopsis poae ATCC 64411]